ncbi:sarcosine oxidase [Xylogone sp. PMI_703]|nr:sarcosine oxidase [Xylogone sp. PMI_703]
MTTPSVLIIGGGAFGISTAYYLSIRGYDKITVLDRFAAPSKDSAATDLNKTVRYDYPNPLYSELAQEAMTIWKSSNHPLSRLFNQTGWIMAAGELAKNFIAATYKASRSPKTRYIDQKDIKARWPELTGPLNGWTSLWSPEAGWVPSGEALSRLALAAQANGVSYIHGNKGHVTKLLFDASGTCIGALSEDGSTHFADVVLLAAGAQTGALIDVEDEVEAKAMCVAAIQLTPEEVKMYKNIPMIDNFEQGMIFPPNEAGVLKICSCRYVTNYSNPLVPGVSIGRSYMDFPMDRIPRRIEEELRDFLRDTLPNLADRQWEWTRMCWDADSKDSDFRVCAYPKHKNLFVATAGSLHGFKFLPVIGKYIADMIEGKLDSRYQDLWQWKFGATPPPSNIERHPYPERDLRELDGWKGDVRAAL